LFRIVINNENTYQDVWANGAANGGRGARNARGGEPGTSRILRSLLQQMMSGTGEPAAHRKGRPA